MQGSLRVTDTTYTTDANISSLTASQAVITDASKNLISRAIYNRTSTGTLEWTAAATDIHLITKNTLAYWNGAYTGTSSNLKILGTVTTGTWNATTIGVGYGGTGKTSWTQWGILYASASTTLANTAAGTAGYLLQSNATSAPSWIQATNANTASTIVKRDSSGNFSAGTITSLLTSNRTTTGDYIIIQSNGTAVGKISLNIRGTTSAEGYVSLTLGNASASTVAENATGQILLYHSDGGASTISAAFDSVATTTKAVKIDTGLSVVNSIETTTGYLYVRAGSIWAGTTASTAGERDVGARAGSGNIYLYATAATTGNRGIQGTNAAGTNTAILTVNQNNQINALTTIVESVTFNLEADKAIFKNTYGSNTYNLIRSHNNGNISLSASNGNLYLGYENTTQVNILGDKMCFLTQTNSKNAIQTILHINGSTYGNTASDMISGTAGLFSWGDGGPQITFDTSATPGGSQAGALIFTDHDTAATGASFHFVSNQTDWNVTSKRFHARTSISIGTNLPSTSYTLSVTGNTFNNGINYFGNGTTYYINNSAAAYLTNITANGSITAYSIPSFISSVTGSPWPYIRFDTRAGGTTYVTTAQTDWAGLYCQLPAKRASDDYYYSTRFFFRQYSKTANTTTRLGYYEDYSLPATDDGRTSSVSYNILTTKSLVTVAQGGTGASTAASARANLGTWALVSDSYNTLMPADGSTNGWVKIGTSNTSYGILPSASGTAGSGHNYIGTSSWYWKQAYIDEIYNGTLNMTGQLYINYNQDVNLGQNGSLIIGSKTGLNIGIDNDEIMARNNSAASTLYLNYEGGNVYVGSGGLSTSGNISANSFKGNTSSGCYFYPCWQRTDAAKDYYIVFQTYMSGSTGYEKIWGSQHNNLIFEGTCQAYSSRYVKHNIQLLTFTSDIIDRLTPVSFIYNNDTSNKQHLGLIYEDTVNIVPQICLDDGQTKTINYAELTPLLLKEIQNLRKRIKLLEEERQQQN